MWGFRATSGLPPIATELRTSMEVRLVPQGDSCTATNGTVFDHLVSRIVTAAHQLEFAPQDVPRLHRRHAEMRTCVCRAKAGRGNRRQVLL
jgi:hypothetical protein